LQIVRLSFEVKEEWYNVEGPDLEFRLFDVIATCDYSIAAKDTGISELNIIFQPFKAVNLSDFSAQINLLFIKLCLLCTTMTHYRT